MYSGEHYYSGMRTGYINAPTLHTDVRIDITGMVARANVKQTFTNPDKIWQEGIYVFPLPEDAAVDYLRMQIGERIIEGQIKEKRQAKKIYNEAKKSGKKASLLEQERPNIFTTSVANIAPKESIVIEIEYQQIISYDNGNFSLRFPLVVAPRYIPGNIQVQGFSGTGWANNTEQVADAARISPPVIHPDKGTINPVSIHLQLHSGFEVDYIKSPYHAIDVSKKTDKHYAIRLKQNNIPADRDFVLSWQPLVGNVPKAALFKQTKQGYEYGLLMVLPPDHKLNKRLNREIIFIIDTSGSMAGTSIRQARSALDMALTRLQKGDRFNIIQFNSRTSQLFHQSQPVNKSNLQQARAYAHSLQARGGTEMAPALLSALQQQDEISPVRQVMFLTDGSVGNESHLFEIIERYLGRSRLFTVGIGSAPNSHFMNRAASFGRGTHTYIGKLNEVQEKMTELFSKIEQPVLTHITMHWPNDLTVESWPNKLPDLYQGEPLLVAFRANQLPNQVLIAGRIADNEWKAKLSLQGGNQKQGVSKLWARRKIIALMDQSYRDNDKNEIQQEILNTALAHHLVSKYTSLVAVDVTPSRPSESTLYKHAMATNLPSGWQYEKVFGRLPATATPANAYFFLGAILLLLSLLYYRLGNRIRD